VGKREESGGGVSEGRMVRGWREEGSGGSARVGKEKGSALVGEGDQREGKICNSVRRRSMLWGRRLEREEKGCERERERM
jgi:hypothetical protein